MPASFSLSAARRPRHAQHQVRPLSVRNFMLVALAIVLAAGVTMLVITQASASEIAATTLTQDAIGAAALGSLLVSSVVAVLLVMRRTPSGHRHSGRDTPAV